MSDPPPDATVRPSPAEHPVRTLTPSPGGGFRLTAAGEEAIRLKPDGSRWRVSGDDAVAGWELGRAEGGGGGLVLRSGDGEEAGRTTPLDGVGGNAKLYYLLLGDGRLFRVAPGGPREGGFELTGWETPGPYLVARPRPDGWAIEPTPASTGLPDVRALSILFAAQIFDVEGVL